MRLSILLTLHNREPEVILAVLRQLSRSDLTETEVIIANDRSTLDYSWVRDYAAARIPNLTWCSTGEYEAWRLSDGSNCPSRAFNRALEHAKGDNVLVMSSDTLVGPRIIEKSVSLDCSEMAWTPAVIDLETCAQYCGPKRLFPAPWALLTTRERVIRVGGWDENFLGGVCYEDNDFIGRVCLDAGRFVADWGCTAWHISHHQPAYEVEKPEVLEANDRNRRLCRDKWSGIPFDPSLPAFDMLRKPWRTGDISHECIADKEVLEKAIAKTKSQFVKVLA